MIHLLLFLLAFAGFAMLCAARDRHQRDLLGRKLPARTAIGLRRTGLFLVLLAYPVAGLALGWGYGAVEWLGQAKLTQGFREMYKCTVAEAVSERRLSHARMLLTLSDLPISSIGYRCGYQSNASFTRAFARRFGMTPTDMRRREGAPAESQDRLTATGSGSMRRDCKEVATDLMTGAPRPRG